MEQDSWKMMKCSVFRLSNYNPTALLRTPPPPVFKLCASPQALGPSTPAKAEDLQRTPCQASQDDSAPRRLIWHSLEQVLNFQGARADLDLRFLLFLGLWSSGLWSVPVYSLPISELSSFCCFGSEGFLRDGNLVNCSTTASSRHGA